jgi:RNA polymerase sigma-70 factor (ECF subfamily)
MWLTISGTPSLSSAGAAIEQLQRALEKLTPDERALVTLFYEEDKPIAEICHILNQTEGNIKVKLYRIRKKLYILIKQEEETR